MPYTTAPSFSCTMVTAPLSLSSFDSSAPPFPVPVRDTTGAGDLYAAGFLHGLAQDWPLDRCGRLGSAAAAHIIARTGARPHEPLAPLIEVTAG